MSQGTGELWDRVRSTYLRLELPPHHQQLIKQVEASGERVLDYLSHYPSANVQRAADELDGQLRLLLLALEAAFRQAGWFLDEAQALRTRSEASGTVTQTNYGAFVMPRPDQADGLQDRVEQNLSLVQSYADAPAQEANIILHMLLESEACVLATITQRNEQQIIEAVSKISALLEQHREAIQRLALPPGGGPD